jgi:hypothetical protein
MIFFNFCQFLGEKNGTFHQIQRYENFSAQIAEIGVQKSTFSPRFRAKTFER